MCRICNSWKSPTELSFLKVEYRIFSERNVFGEEVMEIVGYQGVVSSTREGKATEKD